MNSNRIVNLSLQNKYILIVLFMSVFVYTNVYGQQMESETVMHANSSESLSEIIIPTNNKDVSKALADDMLCSLAANVEGVETNDYDCQPCGGIGGYSQIDTGSSDKIVFQAHSFPYGSGQSHYPCYGSISGTVTFEFEVYYSDTGQQIANSSVTKDFEGGINWQAQCDSYEFSQGPYYNELTITLPGVSGEVQVELATIHKIGSTPGMEYRHETSAVHTLY